MGGLLHKEKGTWVLLCFIAFFGVIVVVNSIFIYNALGTHSGVVTKQPYEKGLAYNETLEKARSQPDIAHIVSYQDGILRWELPGVDDARGSARIVRPVHDGYDFDVTLRRVGGGVYEVQPDLPLRGQWTAKLKATWNNKNLQTAHDFIAR